MSVPDVLLEALLWLVLVICAVTDYRSGTISNRVLMVIGILAVAVLAVSGVSYGWMFFVAGVMLAMTGLGIRWFGTVFLGQPGLGLGDVKLLFVVGLLTSWQGFWILYLAVLAAGVVAGLGMGLKKMDRKSRMRFAPFILAGAVSWRILSPESLFWWG